MSVRRYVSSDILEWGIHLTFFFQMNTRHANIIAVAHFLKTRAEPVLVSGLALIVLGDWKLTSSNSTTSHGNHDLATNR
jgi:hypothetical protein